MMKMKLGKNNSFGSGLTVVTIIVQYYGFAVDFLKQK